MESPKSMSNFGSVKKEKPSNREDDVPCYKIKTHLSLNRSLMSYTFNYPMIENYIISYHMSSFLLKFCENDPHEIAPRLGTR